MKGMNMKKQYADKEIGVSVEELFFMAIDVNIIVNYDTIYVGVWKLFLLLIL
jgi:hypothetical protein